MIQMKKEKYTGKNYKGRKENMNIKKLTKVVRNPKTTAKWIEEEIDKTDSEDIERLCVLATSDKLTADACHKLYDFCKSPKLVIAVAKNPVISQSLRTKIGFDVAIFASYDWNLEERKSILEALMQSATCIGDKLEVAAYSSHLEHEACYSDKRDDVSHDEVVSHNAPVFAYKGYQCYHDEHYAKPSIVEIPGVGFVLPWCPTEDD